MGYKPNWPTEEMKKLVEGITPQEMKQGFEEYGFDVTLNKEIEHEKWTKSIKKGDYVKVVSLDEPLRESVEEVTKVTAKSIFVDKRQYLKETAIQMNRKTRIEPFLAKHRNLVSL